MPVVILIVVIIALVVIVNCVKIVPQAHAVVVERLGGYLTTWSVGLHFKVPFIDRIAKRVLLKEQVVDFPPQPVITKDNVTMQIDTADCRQSPRLFAEDFSVLKRLKVSIFKTFQSLFGIIKVSKKAVLFYDDTRNRKSKKANADGMY